MQTMAVKENGWACQQARIMNFARKAIGNVVESGRGNELQGATAYLYGHWRCCCPSCYEKMEQAGIEKIVLSKARTKQFLNI